MYKRDKLQESVGQSSSAYFTKEIPLNKIHNRCILVNSESSKPFHAFSLFALFCRTFYSFLR